MRKVSLFISYCHEEKDYLKQLKVYLNERDCPKINIWDDGAIMPGKEWDTEIKRRLNSSNIIILLISQSFLNSDYINKTELKIALEKHDKGQCRVIPIFTRFCNLNKYQNITALQGMPKGKWLSSMADERYEAYAYIQQMVNEIADEIETEINISGSDSNEAKTIKQLRDLKKIFLSIPDSEAGLKKRKEFLYQVEGKIKYENWQYEIIPGVRDINRLRDPAYSTSFFTNTIKESLYSIHIISSEKELETGISKIQYELAREHNKKTPFYKCIIWLLTADIKDKLNEQLSQEIGENPNVIGNDYESIFEVIKSIDAEKEKRINKLKKNFSPEKKVFMLYDFSKDHNNDLRISLKTKIEENEELSVRFNSPNENLQKEKEDLEKCHGALIFYGATDSQWYLMRQSLLYDAKNINCKAVCIDEPEIEKKLNRDISKKEFQTTIKGQNELDSGVANFIEGLQH